MLFRSNDTATTEIYTAVNTLSLHDALPISVARATTSSSSAASGPVNSASAVGAFQVAGSSQFNYNSSAVYPQSTLAKDLGTASLFWRTGYVGWITKINENVQTNTITPAATVYIDLATNGVQRLNLSGDSTFHTTNRTGSAGFRGTTVFIKAPATNCVLTLNTNWINFGTNNTVTAISNKWMVFTFGVIGTAESDVLCSYDNQKN